MPDLRGDRVRLLRRRGGVADVLDRQEPQPRAEVGGLARELGHAVEPAVVDDLGDESADVGMHPPRALEEDAHVRRNRRVLAEQVLEHRAPVPSGCVPCETCASCSGSPSSTTLRAAVPIASASASDTCPASSITSVSTRAVEVCVREEPGGSREEQDVGAGAGEVRRFRSRC